MLDNKIKEVKIKMEQHYFWAFFVIALLVGAGFAFAYVSYMNTAALTGYVSFWQRIFGIKKTLPPKDHVMPWPPTLTTGYCSDSDGGINYYVRGTVVSSSGNFTDYCTGTPQSSTANIVVEYYCYNNSVKVINYTCPYGCSNGACINQTNQTCYDSDNGLNFFKSGYCRDKYGRVFYDSCYGGANNTVVEYFCTEKITQFCGNLTASTGQCIDGRCEYTRWIKEKMYAII